MSLACGLVPTGEVFVDEAIKILRLVRLKQLRKRAAFTIRSDSEILAKCVHVLWRKSAAAFIPVSQASYVILHLWGLYR